MGKQKRKSYRGVAAIAGLWVLSLLSAGCMEEERGPMLGFRQAAPKSADAVTVPDAFVYQVYDETLHEWTSELGSRAVRREGAEPLFNPCDAARMYWPEGHVYSFFAAGSASGEPDAGSIVFTREGNALSVRIFNPGHDKDYMAARSLFRSKTAGVEMDFCHLCARISSIRINPGAWLEWLEAKELDAVAELRLSGASISDADNADYVFSRRDGCVFEENAPDYRSSLFVSLESLSGVSAGLRSGGQTLPADYYAFPGRHSLKMSFRQLGYDGRELLPERILCGEFSVSAGESVALEVAPDPSGNTLGISVGYQVADWRNAGDYVEYE